MPRSIGSATISFGLISVGVDLYPSAESRNAVSFNMLHDECCGKVKQQYVCPQHNNEVVTSDHIVKGFDKGKGNYVVLTADEIKALQEKSSGAINIEEFVPLAEVSRQVIEKTYFLGPDKGAEKAYRLLTAGLEETGRGALGQYASRGQQHLVLIRTEKGRLVLEQLRYEDETRNIEDIPVPNADIKPQEVALAKLLIDQTATDSYEPSKYHDTAKERILAAIEAKSQGGVITADSTPSAAPVLDLMAALKASLEAGNAAKQQA